MLQQGEFFTASAVSAQPSDVLASLASPRIDAYHYSSHRPHDDDDFRIAKIVLRQPAKQKAKNTERSPSAKVRNGSASGGNC